MLFLLRDTKPTNFGGAKRDRTADLLHAMQALSQLSYSPTISGNNDCVIYAKLSKIPTYVGGAKRDRTADLLHAMQALSQLSYSPNPEHVSVLTGGMICNPLPGVNGEKGHPESNAEKASKSAIFFDVAPVPGVPVTKTR